MHPSTQPVCGLRKIYPCGAGTRSINRVIITHDFALVVDSVSVGHASECVRGELIDTGVVAIACVGRPSISLPITAVVHSIQLPRNLSGIVDTDAPLGRVV